MLTALIICSFVFSTISLLASMYVSVQVLSMQKSTHNFTMIDSSGKNIKDQIFDALSPEAKEEIEKQAREEYRGII